MMMQGGKGQMKPRYEGSLVKTYIVRPPIIAFFSQHTLPNGHVAQYLEMRPQPIEDLITHVD